MYILKAAQYFLDSRGRVSYKINDWLSVAAGARYVTAKNTYEGLPERYSGKYCRRMGKCYYHYDWYCRPVHNRCRSATAYCWSDHGLLQPVQAGLTLAQAEAASIITTPQRLALEGALTGFGFRQQVTISPADAVFKGSMQ